MAGGKETPRQKMIGMMYLVLTAMLALNVSKSVLDAFVAIEENMQIANETEFARGNEKKEELKEVATDKSNPQAAEKAKLMLDAIDKVDAEVAMRIKFVDEIKLELLKMAGEELDPKNPKSVITTPYDESIPTKPIRMNFNNLGNKENFDYPMFVLGINKSLKAPEGKGAELWKHMMDFRENITKIFIESSPKPDNAPAYSFNDPKIVAYKDLKELKEQVKAAIEKSNVPVDEKEEVIDMYMKLTKNETVLSADKQNIHWIGKTFDHAPMVAALAALTSIQNEYLNARASVISRIRNRVGGGEYSFNKVMALAYAPDFVNQNDSVTVEVLMAAFDSDKQPKVTLDGVEIEDVNDGKGFVHVKAGAADLELKGEITITKKDGSPKTLPWEKSIKVMKPSTSITLPELMVLYKGYNNIVHGVASGADQTTLTASAGITLVKQGEGYIAKVAGNAGTKGSITVAGKNSATGKTVVTQKYDFDLKRLPDPQVFINGKKPGEAITINSTVITAGYGPEIPLKATFTVKSWSLGGAGVNGKAKGAGTNLSARNILAQVAKGREIFVDATVTGPDGVNRIITGVYKKQ